MTLKKFIQRFADDLPNISKIDAELISLFTAMGAVFVATSNTTEKDDIKKELMSYVDMCDKKLK